MTIDAHAHSCGSYLTAPDILRLLDSVGVDRVVLTPSGPNNHFNYPLSNHAEREPYADILSGMNRMIRVLMHLTQLQRSIIPGNQRVYDLRQQLPRRILQCYWIISQNRDELDADYARMHFEMIKLHQCWEHFEVGGAWFCNICDWAEAHYLPLFIHLYSTDDVRAMRDYAVRHPQLKVIIAHLYGMELFREVPLAALPNLYFDLSNCYLASRERTLDACHHFGAERLLLGSDTPYGTDSLIRTIANIRSLPIAESDQQLILGDNIARLLHLDPSR